MEAQISSNRVIYFLVAALTLAALAGIAWGNIQQRNYLAEAEEYVSDYASTVHDPHRYACTRFPLHQQRDCIAEVIANGREYQRQELGLTSQRTAALWTALMGNAAIVGVVLSVAGVLLVWTTFRETREANRIMRSEGRPWLEIRDVKLSHPRISPSTENGTTADRFSCVVSYSITNTGKSPALLLFQGGAGFNSDVEESRKMHSKLITNASKVELAAEGTYIAPGGTNTSWFLVAAEPSHDGSLPIHVQTITIYTTADRDARMVTSHVGFIGERMPDILPIPNDTPIVMTKEKMLGGQQHRLAMMQERTIQMT